MCQIIGAFYFFFVKKPGLIFKFQYLFLIFNFSIFKIFPSRFDFQFFGGRGRAFRCSPLKIQCPSQDMVRFQARSAPVQASVPIQVQTCVKVHMFFRFLKNVV